MPTLPSTISCFRAVTNICYKKTIVTPSFQLFIYKKSYSYTKSPAFYLQKKAIVTQTDSFFLPQKLHFMKKDTQYLLRTDEETLELQDKIKNLLESQDDSSVELAFQLLTGGGVPPALHTHLAVLAIFHTTEKTRKEAIDLLQRYAPPSLLEHLKAHIWNPYHLYEYHEQDMDKFLRQVTVNPTVDKNAFANFVLRITGKGALFCLKNKTAPEHYIIAQLIDSHHYLSLDYFDLRTLPEAVGDFVHLHSLSVEGNPLETLPDNLQNLKALEYLYFTPDIVGKGVLQKFEAFFPNIMATRYHDEAWQLLHVLRHKEALTAIEQACELNPNSPTFWNTLAWVHGGLQQYAQALTALDKALLLVTDDKAKALYHANKGSMFLRMQEVGKAQEEAKIVLACLQKIPQKNWDSEHYFCHGLASYFLQDYEEARKNYEEVTRHDYYYGGGACWYNRACLHARLRQKPLMLNALDKALEAGRASWAREARLDPDFEAYWQDQDFQALLNE